MRRALPLAAATKPHGPSFDRHLTAHGLAPLARGSITTLQINVGKRCNQACLHCHVEAGPKRTEVMPPEVVSRVLELLDASPTIRTVDITGGAPELHPSFRKIVKHAARSGREVIDRCNLTILLERGMESLASFLAEHDVHVIASLPCYGPENVDRQRGRGVFDKSIEALRRLNALGYGSPGSKRRLDLVYNPLGPTLPPEQATLEAAYRRELGARFGVEFHRLLTITNMPIRRFAHALERDGRTDAYIELLVDHFNPRAVEGVMCRALVSVAWDGTLHDCDFHQMLELDLGALSATGIRTVWDLDSLSDLEGAPIATESHCFGCTAGAGSSCGGALDR